MIIRTADATAAGGGLLGLTLILVLGGCSASAGAADAASDLSDVVDVADDSAADSDVRADAADDASAPSDATDEPSETGAADTAGADVDDDPPEVAPPTCDCQPYEYCDDSEVCVDDVCDQGSVTCDSPTDRRVCADDGSSFEVTPCPGAEICYLGVCEEPTCTPNEVVGCDGGQLEVCNSVGNELLLIPCPGGSACLDGECVDAEPNVILLMDTSGSMNWVNEQGGSLAECEGDGCASWAWPSCDDPVFPQTRLGKAKLALQGVLATEEAKGVRLALQRFPQLFSLLGGASEPDCAGAPLMGFDLAIFDNGVNHEVPYESMAGGAPQIMPVPFSPEAVDPETKHAELLRWIDFEEHYDLNDEECIALTQCEGAAGKKACIGGHCGVLIEPELRALGNTPLGRALFYAGEMFRHVVVVQGRQCVADTDCASPHYSCVDGECHDPLRACRANIVVVLSDGGESVDTWPDDFFHPRVQAKRLHYGLECGTSDDCMNGATCVSGVCEMPDADLPPGVCHLTDVPCEDNGVCFADYKYPCGPASTCSGECEDLVDEEVDAKGANVLRDPAGQPISVTVHIVDAANQVNGNSLVAALGGGQHVPVNLDDPASLLDVFKPLLDVKDNIDGCQ